jgi:polyhydroxyalkanoate synthesis regulator phasin
MVVCAGRDSLAAMPQPKKASTTGRRSPSDDETQSLLATIRDLLTRSVMLPSDRLRETLDDAVKRGRITRADAEELVERLMTVGRQQSDDALSRLEGALGGAREDSGGSGSPSGKRSVVRRPPGTDRVLREVDRARRAAGLGSSFPIASYDDLTAAQISQRLDDLSASDLRTVRDYEKKNANRKSVLGAIERRLR